MGTLVTMRIIGVDPGVAIVGFGIIDTMQHTMHPVSYGAITTTANTPFEERLLTIKKNITELIETHRPDVCAIEEVYFSKNVKTAMQVGHARGVILCCCAEQGVPIYHYAPTAIKRAIIGYGGADKKQIQFMTKELLKLKKQPKPDDVADALAIAICHHHSVQFNR